MRLVYIFHSGYVIEADGFALLIDYFKDTGVSPVEGYVHDTLLSRPGKLYVLSSHFHPDHFNPEVLEWKKQKADIQYIFSRDILRHKKAKAEDALYLMKGEQYQDENLKIKAFGSTDIGISFLIEIEGRFIFHAGDLNNWHWKDESTAQEVAVAERNYLNELELLAKTTPHLDVALFPVDPRLGSDFARGAEQFIHRIETGLFAPMHFGERYNKLLPFKQYAQERGVPFAGWTEKGQSVDI
ncbi:MBL fold metallo-hydrolase [Parabacteroides sp. 52]|uniref:MBL fold metallo-hydrolase n=1 Tax=unclassified Parabacteroides TaxID=2649774 RepID=UPI0013D73347|nr:MULTISPECIES: MBL fold metallo-hydrolase [unclassified Parabacteroides]MDH6535119.1 L-ascorbate metabolism protein UlaG (beta-lactamase superfamily) [Parabacteroides sp. PM5-20]NDV55481.1 MBL fold metallo-hydrolase [Parabacteroides sp. 52]